MTDYGRDLKTVVDANGNVDLTPGMLESTGRAVLAESLVRRQTTRRGSVIDAPNDCFDIRDWLSSEMIPTKLSQLRGTLRAELEKDERVKIATVTMAYNEQSKTLTITEAIDSTSGPFKLTLSVTDLTISLLTEGV